VIRNALYVACKAAKIPVFSGNDLRLRRQSLWHLHGVAAAVIASRVGHRRVSTSLDHYTHVTIPAEELPDEEAEALLLAAKVAPLTAGSG
jgi:integrase